MNGLFGGRPPEGNELAQQTRLGTVDPADPRVQHELLTRRDGEEVINKDSIRRAAEILAEYKRGKANLETRIVEDELWYKLRHWEVIGRNQNITAAPRPASAWLFNTIMNKHADAMDNYPEPIVLPRERSDEQSAKILSSVLPVIFEQNDFEKVYYDAWWEKLKHGCPCYGVFWNNRKENGLGDVDIRNIDLLNLFWEPGVTDIQNSRNLFILALEDADELMQIYPQLNGKLRGGKSIDVKEYIYDDTVDNSKKVVVVDWYYKVRGADGRTLLHYVKFVEDEIIFASENDPQYSQRGWYDHGKYPVVLDPLFPEKGTPVGFGYVAICKDPQIYIDKLHANILEKSLADTKKRYFASDSLNINEDDLLDVSKPIVKVQGMIDETKLREIKHDPLDGIYLSVLQGRIEEMKDTASNRDASNGGAPGGGITAASAIAALQEAGNKSSRDMIKASYRAHTQITQLVIDLIRQFYDEARSFRITEPNTAPGYSFVELDNSKLGEQEVGFTAMGEPLFRKPIFDLKIKAQRKNPFSRMEQNELAMQFYSAGFFAPEMAQQSLAALEMMDFEGIDKVREQLREITSPLTALSGMTPTTPQAGDIAPPSGITGEIMQARSPMTSYGQSLAERSVPSVEG